MGWKKLVVCILFLPSGCGYFTTNFYKNRAGGERPKSPRYALAKPKPYQLTKVDLLDTSAVYVSAAPVKIGAKTDTVYAAFRFFSNGRVFRMIAADRNEISTTNMNNIGGAALTGYFRVTDGDNIAIEYFGITKNPNNLKVQKYRREDGFLRNDSLILFTDPGKNVPLPTPKFEGAICKNCRIYIKQKMEGLSGQPDW